MLTTASYETMFNLSANVSSSYIDEDDDKSDDDTCGQHGMRNKCQDAASQGWTYLTESNCQEVSISIDGIDNRLLDRARKEVPVVLLNLKKELIQGAIGMFVQFCPVAA
jgi:hypothetical protein